jgi:hypothetical protein
MIDWNIIAGFDWDAGNERKNVHKHRVSKLESEQVFFNQPLLILQDSKHSGDENRFHALGKSDNCRLIHVTFTLRSKDTLVRVISARNMHKKERKVYEQA